MNKSIELLRGFAALLLMIGPAWAWADGTLYFSSEAGDYIGGGSTYSLNFTDSDVEVTASAQAVSVYYFLNGSFWSLWLRAPAERSLAPACYERAQRAPFAEYGRPGVEFDFDGAGCNEIVGRYKVIELEDDPDTGSVSKLAVDFVQHCEGNGPALFGKLRYNSTVGLDTPALDPVFETSGTLHFVSDPGDYIGGGADRTFDLDRSDFGAGVNYDAGVSGSYFDDSDWWMFDFAAADGVPLTEGSYQGAVRFPFQEAGQPALDFVYDGSGCNTLSGNFDVTALDFDPIDGNPTRFQDHFVQHCENADPALTADVDFTTVYNNGPLVADALFIDGLDGATEWPLVWNCN